MPTVTREDSHTTDRIGTLIADGRLFVGDAAAPGRFDPEHDCMMLCGSMAMIKAMAALLETEASPKDPMPSRGTM